MSVPMHLDFLDSRRARQKSSLDANAVRGDTPYGEIALVTAFANTYYRASNQLNPLTLPLDDSKVYSHAVP